ncbi:aromatic ring-hydroxylating oxygenase subunit alpha [Saccharospirillum mangrovi]|uniref:aromatic ring-hydroxylating oxygenase subunit alpha n=1 Tax=Saccharospirillum mangrovi TaxID=2161747 RepID=UPI00130068CD|nr:aromatic ring-hydroxylating dioxygenase subunit alpha [Saccharospirillum mangrovi]
MNSLDNFPYPGVTECWHPLLESRALKDKPVSVSLMGLPLVLVRLNGQPRLFTDRCPHRLIPLSQGFVERDCLVCPYHGWAFDGDGQLRGTPGTQTCNTTAKLSSFPVQEKDGLLWTRMQGEGGEPLGFSDLPGYVHVQAYRSLDCNFFQSIENFLDPCHTPYVHKGLLRNRGAQQMRISQSVHSGGFRTQFDLPQRQNGWINRLFDPGVNRNVGRFDLPGRVELDYLKDDRILLRVVLFFVPHGASKTGIFARLYATRSWLPSALRFAMFKPFAETLFRQDRAMLEQQQAAVDRFGEHYRFADTDIVARPLWALLHGQTPKAGADIELNVAAGQ